MKSDMADLIAFDTNIYFYALDSTTAAKHLLARNLIRSAGRNRSVVLLQVLGELANAFSKRNQALLPAAGGWLTTSEPWASPPTRTTCEPLWQLTSNTECNSGMPSSGPPRAAQAAHFF
jgi:predicted nucleic acid-binding protein